MTEYIERYKKEGDNYVFVGDFIKSIKISDDTTTITFTYVIGGHYLRSEDGKFISHKEGTGVEYSETYDYNPNAQKTVSIEGQEVVIYYHDIDYSSNSEVVYNEDLNLTGTTCIATINKMRVADTFTSEDSIQTPSFKDDTLMGIIDTPKYKINVEIDRGGLSVNERHFKMSECNTLEDLLNYGNNFFGLE